MKSVCINSKSVFVWSKREKSVQVPVQKRGAKIKAKKRAKNDSGGGHSTVAKMTHQFSYSSAQNHISITWKRKKKRRCKRGEWKRRKECHCHFIWQRFFHFKVEKARFEIAPSQTKKQKQRTVVVAAETAATVYCCNFWRPSAKHKNDGKF